MRVPFIGQRAGQVQGNRCSRWRRRHGPFFLVGRIECCTGAKSLDKVRVRREILAIGHEVSVAPFNRRHAILVAIAIVGDIGAVEREPRASRIEPARHFARGTPRAFNHVQIRHAQRADLLGDICEQRFGIAVGDIVKGHQGRDANAHAIAAPYVPVVDVIALGPLH